MTALAIGDVVEPEQFAPYVTLLTEEKSRLIQSGALARSPMLDNFLVGGGRTFNAPTWNDVQSDEDRVATLEDVPDQTYQALLAALQTGVGGEFIADFHQKIDSNKEIAVRLERNQSWKTADLLAALAGSDPADVIANRVASYWRRRLQAAYISTWQGVIIDNATNDQDTSGDGDYCEDISGGNSGSFTDGVTNFSAEAFIDAANTMGDSSEDLSMVMVHSMVYARMKKNNLIDFIPDARGEVNIPTFLGHEVVVDDGMPSGTDVVLGDGTQSTQTGMYETWLFGPGATQLGVGSPKVPAEVNREPNTGNGSGGEVLYSRLEWSIHPAGHAFQSATVTDEGGPSNAELKLVANWDRVFPERKQIKFARLITREST